MVKGFKGVKEEGLDLYKKKVVGFLKQNFPGLSCVYLFGSVAINKDNKESDIDIAFHAFEKAILKENEAKMRRFKLMGDLNSLLAKDVDLIDMSYANPIINFQIFKKGKVLYKSKDPELIREFEIFKVNELDKYYDFQIERESIKDIILNSRVIT